MNIFKLWRGYRKLGPSYGLPTWYVDCGLGAKYEPLKLIEKLATQMSLKKEGLVVTRNGMGERGIGVFVQGLKYLGVKVEVECSGRDVTPGWFPMVDRWIVEWADKNIFNYMALRPRQDLLVCKDGFVEFLDKTKDVPALRAIITGNIERVWYLVKDTGVRVYGEEKDENLP